MVRKAQIPVKRRIPLKVEGLLLPLTIAVILVGAGFFFSDWNLLRQSRIQIERLNLVLSRNEALLSSLKDLETGQRGYLLTGDANYLAPYRVAKQVIPGEIDALASVVINPEQKARVAELRPLIQDKISEVDATLTVRDQLGSEPALAIVRSDRGRLTLDQIRGVCAAIREGATQAILANSRQAEAQHNRALYGILLACGVLVGLQLIALSLIRRASARREELINELEIARNHLQVTLSSIGDGVITTDASGVVTFLNPVAAELTGWSHSDAQGKIVEEVFPIFHEVTGVTVENPVRRVILEQKILGLANHTNLIRRDKSRVPIDDSAAPIFDSQLRLIGVVMVFRDMTRRKLTSDALQRWEHIFAHAGFGMAILSPGENPVIEQINPAFARMHGYQVAELAGKPYSMLVPADIWPMKRSALRGESPAGDHILMETPHVRKDGSTFPALSDVTLVRNEEGNIAYCTGYYSDISDRKRAEEELRASEERYRTTADSLPQLVWTSKADGTTEYLNHRWQDQIGLAMEAITTAGWHYFLDDEDRERCIGAWRESLSNGQIFETECRFKGPAGHPSRWYMCRAVPLRDSQGRIERWFGTCTDIHEQREAADLLRSTNEALRMSNLDLEQFAYAASHDLQEPLRMVVIYSQLLQAEYGEKLSGQGSAYLDFAVDGALRMEQLLKDLLSYSKVGTPDSGVTLSANSKDALDKALVNLEALIQQTSADVDIGALPAVRIPEIHLVQVFQNLVGNSLKYRKKEVVPRIQINAAPEDGMWLFSIRDNGIGLAPEHREQIFRVFRRLHGQDFPGTGIGLALCKKLIERHGGKIWVASQPGEGATFYFTLPASLTGTVPTPAAGMLAGSSRLES